MGSGWIWVTIALAGISNITMSGSEEAVLPYQDDTRTTIGGAFDGFT